MSTEADTVQMLCKKPKPVNWFADRDITVILFDLRLKCLLQFRKLGALRSFTPLHFFKVYSLIWKFLSLDFCWAWTQAL